MDDHGRAIATLLIAIVMLATVCLAAMRRPADRQSISATVPIAYRINPNHADAQTLSLLPGIGPSIAQNIIQDRQANGPYHAPEDLERVSRIGEKTVAAVRPWITLEPRRVAPD